MAAATVGFYFSVGFGIGDAFRALLVRPAILGAVLLSPLILAGLLAGFAPGRRRLLVNLAVIYLGLVGGRLLVLLWLGMGGESMSSSVLQAVTLGFTVDAAVYNGLEHAADPIALRVSGVLLQVVSVGVGVTMARVWSSRRATARLA